MPIFSKAQRRQQYLIAIFALVILITFAVFWFGVINPPSAPIVTTPPAARQITINFDFLTSQEVKDLQPYVKITLPETLLPIDQKVGRENPFVPY